MTDLFPERVETERLRLDALTTESVDLLAFYAHVHENAPHIDEVTKYLTWSPHETPRETAEFVETVTESRDQGDGATYLVRTSEPPDVETATPATVLAAASADADEPILRFAGVTGISVDWDRQLATLGTWLRKPYWGRGYSGERARALVELAFERLDLDAVSVTVHRGNEKSRTAVSRYVESLGGRHEGLLRNFETDGDGTVVDVHRYTVTRAEYDDAQAGR